MIETSENRITKPITNNFNIPIYALILFIFTACSQTESITLSEPVAVLELDDVESIDMVNIPIFFNVTVLEIFNNSRGEEGYTALPNATLRIFDEDFFYDNRTYMSSSSGQLIIPSSELIFNQVYLFEVRNVEGTSGSYTFFYDQEFLDGYGLEETIYVVIGQDIQLEADLAGQRRDGIRTNDPRGVTIQN